MNEYLDVVTPRLRVINSVVVDVNDELLRLTGYSKDEFMGKDIEDIYKLLRMYSQIMSEDLSKDIDCFIFTKDYEPIEVKIRSFCIKREHDKFYLFIEKVNSRIENVLPYASSILAENLSGFAICSEKGILLKVNNIFFDMFGLIFKDRKLCIGKNIYDFNFNDEKCNLNEGISSVIKTGKPYRTQFECYNSNNILKHYYISIMIINIFGKTKYMILDSYDITDKLNDKKLITEKKEELEAIIENMSDGVLVLDKDYKNYVLNDSAKGLYKNISCVDQINSMAVTSIDSDTKLIHFEDDIINNVFTGNVIKSMRIAMPDSNGETYMNISGSPMYDKNGNVEKAIFCFRDITEQVNKDKLILQQKEELGAIIENISDELIIIDKNGNFVNLNKAARDNPLHKDVELIKPFGCYEHVKHYDSEGNLIPFENLPPNRLLRGEKFSESRILVKNCEVERYYEVSGIPIYDYNGNFLVGVLVLHNITDRLKYEENLLLKKQHEILNKLIENLELGVARYSYPDLKLIDMNNKAFINFKFAFPHVESLSSIKGKSIFDFFKSKDFEKSINNIIYNKSFYKIKKIVNKREEKYLKYIYQPLYGLNYQLIEIVVICIDVTDYIKDKYKMEEVLKMQDELFVNVSHELKTPLNIIFSATQLMELYLKNDLTENNLNKVIKSINSVKQNCYRLTKLINNILDLSKMESGNYKINLSNEDIVLIIKNIVQSVSDYVLGKNLSIIFDSDVESKIISVDAISIERVILNLISNAIKFTNSGGRIFVNVKDLGSKVEISVKDTGIGIDKPHLKEIFNRFSQVDKSLSRNTEGSGIGLSLVKSIVKSHGGDISVTSKVGEGSEFKMVLPCKTIRNSKTRNKLIHKDNRIDMINIEFSDIYDKGWN